MFLLKHILMNPTLAFMINFWVLQLT